MRDLTEEELKLFRRGYCPVCYQNDQGFAEGPQGGISQNLMCFNCKCKLNVVLLPGIPLGQLIGEPDLGYPTYPRPKLQVKRKGLKAKLQDLVKGWK